MKTLLCYGTPYELGLAHGVGAKDMIRRSILFYKKMFAYTCKLEWDAVRMIAKDWKREIEQKWSNYYSEMQGIANGAEIPVVDILILNIRTEIAFGMFNDGCTSLYWKTDRQSFLAQNWDWMEEQKQNLLLLDINRVGGPRIKMITEAGIIGKIGLNEFGIGVCLNAIKVPGCDFSRLPVHLGLRKVLESTSVDAAVRELEEVGIAASAHILIADQRKAIGLETTARTLQVMHMTEGDRIFHANHLLLAHDGAVDGNWLPDSPARQHRIQQLATKYAPATGGGPNTVDIMRMLDDHEGFPYSICRYEKGPLGMDATLFSIVMELRGRIAIVRLGRPCQVEETVELCFE
ncbi:AAT-domain-containing protein [Aspergillus saccharolyticus JOP 1030-1]|uniref:AAT-domain-containing protein n=1 Tax=Aspergillus saccharolyticus JOP 1030-1 TaxID=1450539 RepID=A0A319AJV4_9EURO|nr:AAT-domain-containing protein [Aspergillus saccharolyticus JOP 1030-1]PYH46912.1 AAT-domain-containing protein [Aspergillus saccharolyticus JOP 1030-1]